MFLYLSLNKLRLVISLMNISSEFQKTRRGLLLLPLLSFLLLPSLFSNCEIRRNMKDMSTLLFFTIELALKKVIFLYLSRHY